MRKIIFMIGKHLVSNYGWFWRAVSEVPPLRRAINRLFINALSNAASPRPHPYAVWGPGANPNSVADYISWTGLVDRRCTGRHLPPADAAAVAALPDLGTPEFAALFRRQGAMIPCPKSSALFGFFAQWFTDSFLRTDPDDVRKNTSNHEIDLCQIYGLDAADADLLRSHVGGELKAQQINGEEYPPYLFDAAGLRVRNDFLDLSYVDKAKADFRNVVLEPRFNTPQRKKAFFVTGLERGNSTIFYSAFNVVFLREHNRLCRALAGQNKGWDDDRLFETARNINIALLLKIIIEDYINHLSPALFRMSVEIGFAERQDWYRANRICAEFNLLYRWHQLVPTTLEMNGVQVPDGDFRFNNAFLTDQGLENVIGAGAAQRAGRIALRNTAPFLVQADLEAIKKSRAWRVRSYNDYREIFGLWRVASFEELAGDVALAAQLRALYQHVDRVEFPVGLFAEARSNSAMLGDLMTAMVAVDAFSQALTNPLLAERVFNDRNAFPATGRKYVEDTASFDAVVQRNTKLAPRKARFTIQAPPGGCVLPALGTLYDTLDFLFLSGWHGFFERRRRRHGSGVFRVYMFQPSIALLDDRAIAAMFASGDLVPDRPSQGFQFQIPPLPILGGVAPGMFEADAAHDRPKALYQSLLQRRAGTLATVFIQTFEEFAARWLARGSFGWRDELEDFAASFAGRWMLGASPPPADLRYLFSNIFSQWAGAVTKYLPWSSYTRCVRLHQELVQFVKDAPAFGEIMGLARAAGLADEDLVAKQITYFLGNNTFLGLQSLFKSVVGELSQRPELRAALREEIVAVFGASPGEIDLRKLDDLRALDRVLREILRLHPPVFFLLARATRDRVIESNSGTFAIANGELVMGVIPFAHMDDAVHADPERFDPDRFAKPEVSRHLIWPRGLHDGPITEQNRTCPGKDVAILIAKLFCVALLPRYHWDLKEPPRWGKHFFTLNVAAPVGPLVVTRFLQPGAPPPG